MISSGDFEAFLETINLGLYRKTYNPVKMVEMDMPKNIRAMPTLYEAYWEKQTLLGFEDFYQKYLKDHKKPLEAFRRKTFFCKICFYRGLPARIYRTWSSTITHIQAAYIARDIFGFDAVQMSTDLDYAGADIRVHYAGQYINFQVKKESYSREVRQTKPATRKLDGEYIILPYSVLPGDLFENQYYKIGKDKGQLKKDVVAFNSNPNWKLLTNGFVVFTPEVFTGIKAVLDAGGSLEKYEQEPF